MIVWHFLLRDIFGKSISDESLCLRNNSNLFGYKSLKTHWITLNQKIHLLRGTASVLINKTWINLCYILTSLVFLQQRNVKKSKKLMKIVSIEGESLYIFWTTWEIWMKFSGNLWLMIMETYGQCSVKRSRPLSIESYAEFKVKVVDTKLCKYNNESFNIFD